MQTRRIIDRVRHRHGYSSCHAADRVNLTCLCADKVAVFGVYEPILSDVGSTDRDTQRSGEIRPQIGMRARHTTSSTSCSALSRGAAENASKLANLVRLFVGKYAVYGFYAPGS